MTDTIEKDKIRAKIEEYRFKACASGWENNATLDWCADDLEEMLEND